jgi:hypothetical protein
MAKPDATTLGWNFGWLNLPDGVEYGLGLLVVSSLQCENLAYHFLLREEQAT